MELRKLRYFVATAEEGNVRRAAGRLRVTQPSLSEQIHELERQLGVLLFDRLPRGIRLTQAGTIFLAEARQVLARLEQAFDQARRAGRGEVGLLRVAFTELGAGQRVLADALHRFRKMYPAVALDLRPLSSAEQIDALRHDRIDVGFCHLADEPEDWTATLALGTARYMLAISKYDPLARKRRLDTQDLASRTLIWSHRAESSHVSEAKARHFQALGIHLDNALATGSNLAPISFASAGMGIGVILSSHKLDISRTVVFRPLPGPPLLLRTVMAWRKDNESRQLAHFLATIRRGEKRRPGRRIRLSA